jgi:putative Ca2+/H+ antiporter (TMEM165/GDT1 family)
LRDLAIAATVFVVTALAELPDKSVFATLIMGTRYSPLPVWAGTAAAFTAHVAIAVTAGQLLTLMPHRVLDAVVAALFLAGAVYLIAESFRHEETGDGEAEHGGRPQSPLRVSMTAFGVIFLAEWGDITQITTANLAARYASPLAVGVGAVLALWAVSALAVTVASKVLHRIPAAWLRRVTAVILLGFAAYSAVAAIAG